MNTHSERSCGFPRLAVPTAAIGAATGSVCEAGCGRSRAALRLARAPVDEPASLGGPTTLFFARTG